MSKIHHILQQINNNYPYLRQWQWTTKKHGYVKLMSCINSLAHWEIVSPIVMMIQQHLIHTPVILPLHYFADKPFIYLTREPSIIIYIKKHIQQDNNILPICKKHIEDNTKIVFSLNCSLVWFSLAFRHINHCWLFNPEFCFYKYIKYIICKHISLKRTVKWSNSFISNNSIRYKLAKISLSKYCCVFQFSKTSVIFLLAVKRS